MISRTECSKCGSHKVIPNVQVDDQGRNGTREMTVSVLENPNAILFMGAHLGTVRAWVCGTCGYMELYVENSEELYTAYEKGRIGG